MKSSPMKSAERRQFILTFIKENKEIRISEIAEHLATSVVTIRADLKYLEEKELIVRHHGGASLKESSVSFANQNVTYLDEKVEIARKASAFIKSGMTVLIDSGTTTLEIAKQIKDDVNCCVITNSLAVAVALEKNQNIMLVLTGGALRRYNNSFHGEISERALAGLSADIMFLGADGLDLEKGATTFSDYSIGRAMSRISKKIILTVDSSKFGRKCLNQVLPIEEIDVVITDAHLSEDVRQEFNKKGIVLL